ncbi:hypothetical protein HZA97_00990 [Candidatus Woesearchaeota archaeon]|nr:hypothetical protein [Candidatus Woesearchaeota archaeon]
MSNKYSKALVTGLVVLGLSGIASSQEENQPEQPTKVERTLTSTPDANTTLNEDLAAKVRKLAELVMTKEKGTVQKQVDKFGTFVYATITFSDESKGYEVIVYDDNGTAEITNPENHPSDVLIIGACSLTETNERKAYFFADGRLDGNLNRASTYVAPTNNLFPPAGIIGGPEFEENQLKEFKVFEKDWLGEVILGAEYQEELQVEYEKVLDELIKIYKTE